MYESNHDFLQHVHLQPQLCSNGLEHGYVLLLYTPGQQDGGEITPDKKDEIYGKHPGIKRNALGDCIDDDSDYRRSNYISPSNNQC